MYYLLQLNSDNTNAVANAVNSAPPNAAQLPTVFLLFGSLLLLGIIFVVLKIIGKILNKIIVDKIMKD